MSQGYPSNESLSSGNSMTTASPPVTPPALSRAIHSALSRRKSASTLRRLSLAPAGSIDFSSNDFLSLSTSQDLRTRYLAELNAHPELPLGSGGSRLLDGNTTYAESLERRIASFHNAPAALLTNSGFDANVAIFSTLPQPDSIIIYDELIHASVHDGIRAGRTAPSHRFSFAHNSVSSFTAVLSHILSHPTLLHPSTSIFIAVEAIYSMDGDTAPLPALISALTRTFSPSTLRNTHLIIDEAHATGVLGAQGRGLVSSLGLESSFLIRLHTFGKALSANGAAILCTPEIKAYLLNYARSLIYTTFLSLPSLALVSAAYDMMASGATEALARDVMQNARLLWEALVALQDRIGTDRAGLLVVSNEVPASPIFSVRTTDPRGLAAWCQGRGFVVRPIVPPTVPPGSERVRVCLHAGNTEVEIRGLVRAMQEWCERAGKRGAARL